MVNFTTINHEARIKLKLSWLEYGLADLVYNLSNNPKSDYPNWCYASKQKMAEMLGTTKKTVHEIINRLIKQELLERHPETKHLRITIDWYKEVLIKEDSNERLLPVTKGYSDSNERLLGGSNERLHNKDIYNKDNNNNILPNSNMAKTPHGNFKVNFLLDEFTKRFGFPPTDSKPRNEAWNLSRRIDTWIKGYGKEPNEEIFKKAGVALYDWIEKQDWGEKIQLLGTIRRKSVIFMKPKGGQNASPNQETSQG